MARAILSTCFLERNNSMTFSQCKWLLTLIAVPLVALVPGSASAQLAPNQTQGFGNGRCAIGSC
jgi:hypothetical protein